MRRQEAKTAASILDQLIPLRDASHCDVVDYRVDVPLRYAEVGAELSNGSIAKLQNPRQFVGWAGYGKKPTLLFNCGAEHLVVNARADHTIPLKFIARDGALIAPTVSA